MIDTPQTTAPPLPDRAIAFLTQECDRMLSLYEQAQSNAQSVFNFYLTFVSAVIGGLVVVIQTGTDARQTQAIIGGLLFFAVIVGTVYLSALSGRYAHSARYAWALDELRRYLIDRMDIPVPSIYGDFLQNNTPDRGGVWWAWLMPTGTYQMFMALVSSAALAGVTLMVFTLAGGQSSRAIIAMVLVFILTLTVFNAYSRLVIRRFGSRMNVDLWRDSPAWAAHD